MGDSSEKSQNGKTDTDELIEVLAEQAHESWRGWMKWLRSRSVYYMDSGMISFEAKHIYRWEQQEGAGYYDLPAEQRASDRKEALEIIQALERAGYAIVKTES